MERVGLTFAPDFSTNSLHDMNKLLGLGRWLFILSFSMYVMLHFALPDVGVQQFVPKFLPFQGSDSDFLFGQKR